MLCTSKSLEGATAKQIYIWRLWEPVSIYPLYITTAHFEFLPHLTHLKQLISCQSDEEDIQNMQWWGSPWQVWEACSRRQTDSVCIWVSWGTQTHTQQFSFWNCLFILFIYFLQITTKLHVELLYFPIYFEDKRLK